MGEILATVYVQATLGYTTGPSRLIERDHQEWALRGDDVLGARLSGTVLERWLKFYNTGRRHSALGGLPPISRVS